MADQQLSTRELAQASDAEDDAEQTPPEGDGPGAHAGNGHALHENQSAHEIEGRDDEFDHTDAAEPATTDATADERESLLPGDQSDRFTTQWQEIQASFVDRPRESVEQADALVADLMQRLAASFSNERERLEAQWDRGDDVSTEDLRVALTRYRSFFDRLLSA
jgi:hypothetical protein